MSFGVSSSSAERKNNHQGELIPFILGYTKLDPAPLMRGSVNKKHWLSNIKLFLHYAIIFILKMLNGGLKE